MARRGVKRGGKRGGRSLTFLTPGRKSIDVGWGSRVGLRNAWKGGNVAGRAITNNQAYFLNKATRTFLTSKQIAPFWTWSTGESRPTHSFLGQFHNAPVGLGSKQAAPVRKTSRGDSHFKRRRPDLLALSPHVARHASVAIVLLRWSLSPPP